MLVGPLKGFFFRVDLNAGHPSKFLVQIKFDHIVGAFAGCSRYCSKLFYGGYRRIYFDASPFVVAIIMLFGRLTVLWHSDGLFSCVFSTRAPDRYYNILSSRRHVKIKIIILCIQNKKRETAAGGFYELITGGGASWRVIVSVRLQCPSCRVIIIDSILVPIHEHTHTYYTIVHT